jgi:hypothetical protein
MFYSALFCLVSSHVLSLSNPASLRLLGVRVWVFGLPGLVFAQSSFAAPVTLQLTASTDPQLAVYKVYYGYASRQYSVTVDVGTSTTAAFSSLRDAQIYYFAVTGYDASGKESAFSNEVSYDLAMADTDKDGLSDWDEISLYKTDPTWQILMGMVSAMAMRSSSIRQTLLKLIRTGTGFQMVWKSTQGPILSIPHLSHPQIA